MPFNLSVRTEELNNALEMYKDIALKRRAADVPPHRLADGGDDARSINVKAIKASRTYRSLMALSLDSIQTAYDASDPLAFLELLVGASLEAGITVGYTLRMMDAEAPSTEPQ